MASFDSSFEAQPLRGLDHPPKLWLPVWTASLGPWPSLLEAFNEPVDLEDVYLEAIAIWEGAAVRPTLLTDRTLQYFTQLYLQERYPR